MKIKFTKQILIALVLAVALTAIVAAPVLAGLRVTNAKLEQTVSPGQAFTYVINVGDNTDAPMDIAVDIDGMGNYLGGSVMAVTQENDSSPYSARAFVTASPARFHLEAGQSQNVNISVSVPANVGDGGRYAVVLIRTIPTGGTGIGISTAIAAQILLTIQGSNMIITGDASSLNLSVPKSEQKFSIAATVNNSGNYHYKLSFGGTIKDNLGQVVGTAWQTNSSYNLIPAFASQTDVAFNISRELTPGMYTAQVDAYTTKGVFLDSNTIEFALTDTYKPMPLKTLSVDFWDTGKTSDLQWAVAEDGTLMQAVSASSLNSTVTISIAQGAKVTDATGKAAASISITMMDPAPSPPEGYTMISSFNFLPGAITFNPKADITLEYPSDKLLKGASETKLTVAYLDQTSLQWTFIDNCEINPGTNKISFATTHSGIYAILAPPTPKAATILGLEKTTWMWIGMGVLWIVVVILILLVISKVKHKRISR